MCRHFSFMRSQRRPLPLLDILSCSCTWHKLVISCSFLKWKSRRWIKQPSLNDVLLRHPALLDAPSAFSCFMKYTQCYIHNVFTALCYTHNAFTAECYIHNTFTAQHWVLVFLVFSIREKSRSFDVCVYSKGSTVSEYFEFNKCLSKLTDRRWY